MHQLCQILTDLNPADENHDGNSRVEGDLPEGEAGEVRVRIRAGEQRVELAVDFGHAVDAEDGADDGNQNHHDVQDVPERLEVRQTNLLDLQPPNK